MTRKGSTLLNDGFGDLSAIEEALLDLEPQIKGRARRLRPQDPDDAAQEGRIAAWKSLQENPDRRDYASVKARHGIGEHLRSDHWTGTKTGVAGKPADPIRRRRDSLDDPDFHTQIAAVDDLEAVLLAYHYGEIVQVINSLAPDHREYVVLRFWGGYSNPEIAEIQGKSNGYVKSAWVKVIRPRLQEALTHLSRT